VAKRKRKRQAGASLQPTPAVAQRQRVTFEGGVLDTSEWRTGVVNAEAALGIDVFYACVRLIADGVASAPWGEWRGLVELEPSRLVLRPMASMTRREWTWRVAATMAIYSYCPLRIVGGLDSEGVPWSLVPLNPAALSRNPDSATFTYGTETIPLDDLRFVRRTSLPVASPDVQAIIRLAQDQLEAAASASQYVSAWWEAGGAPVVVLSTDQELTKDQGDEIAARWLERREKGPAFPAVLGKGAHANPFGANLGADEAHQAQDRLIASVARFMGVPASYVNAPSYAGSLTYQNVQQAGLDLVRYTLDAYALPIGDLLGDQLPGDYIKGRTVRLDLRGLTLGDQLNRYQAWESALRAGWLDEDEVRQAEGYAPRETAAEPAPAPDLVELPANAPEVPA
jgi:phage portal protein BeeE